jgi:hypothetical protein
MKRHRTLYAMKQELKTLRGIRYHYRHLHIARCLLKGRTMEQIEPVVRDCNKRDEKYLARLLEKWSAALQAEHAEDAAAMAVA